VPWQPLRIRVSKRRPTPHVNTTGMRASGSSTGADQEYSHRRDGGPAADADSPIFRTAGAAMTLASSVAWLRRRPRRRIQRHRRLRILRPDAEMARYVVGTSWPDVWNAEIAGAAVR
jgi:hypothetical protein